MNDTSVLRWLPPYEGTSNRLTFWHDFKTGKIVFPNGTEKSLAPNTELTTLLGGIERYTRAIGNARVVSLYLRCGLLIKNKPGKGYFRVSDGWKEDLFLSGKLCYRYTRGDFTVYLYATANYFGEELDVLACRAAFYRLQDALMLAFHFDHFNLAWTPASAGKYLLERSLPQGKRYPALPDALIDLISHNFGQGRIEHFPPSGMPLKAPVSVLDGYWMYAGCLSHLPIGKPLQDKQDAFLGVLSKGTGSIVPTVPGFYYARVTVPRDWQHIGLLQAENYDSSEASGYYPRVPGETFVNWFTASELALALTHNWPISIKERIVFPETGRSTEDPLAHWRKTLVSLRASVMGEDKVSKLIRGAIRTIVLHTIGSFHRSGTIAERFTPRGKVVPSTARIYSIDLVSPKGTIWKEIVPLATSQLRFVHPEFSATVWGRARAKLAAFALQIPFDQVMSLRTDSVWCTDYPANIVASEDSIIPGMFRLKDTVKELSYWPKDSAAMRRFIVERNIRLNDSTEVVPDSEILEDEREDM